MLTKRRRQRAQANAWSYEECWTDNAFFPGTDEFTVHENIGPAAVAAYLAFVRYRRTGNRVLAGGNRGNGA